MRLRSTQALLLTTLFIAFIAVSSLTGCTGGGQESSVSQIIAEIIGTNPSAPQETQKQVQEIQKTLNQDPQYALTSDDTQLLESQGLIENNDSIKTWVK